MKHSAYLQWNPDFMNHQGIMEMFGKLDVSKADIEVSVDGLSGRRASHLCHKFFYVCNVWFIKKLTSWFYCSSLLKKCWLLAANDSPAFQTKKLLGNLGYINMEVKFQCLPGEKGFKKFIEYFCCLNKRQHTIFCIPVLNKQLINWLRNFWWTVIPPHNHLQWIAFTLQVNTQNLNKKTP